MSAETRWQDVAVSPEHCRQQAQQAGLLAAAYARTGKEGFAYGYARLAATWYAAHEELQAEIERKVRNFAGLPPLEPTS